MKLVTDEVAALAEALGFWSWGQGTAKYKKIGDRTCSIPRQAELQHWLREHYGITVLVSDKGEYKLYKEDWNWQVTMHYDPTSTYEELLERALKLGLIFANKREVRENEAHSGM